MRNTFRQAITAVAGKSRRALAAESRIVIHANGFAVAERRPNCTRLGHLRLLQCVYCERKQEMLVEPPTATVYITTTQLSPVAKSGETTSPFSPNLPTLNIHKPGTPMLDNL